MLDIALSRRSMLRVGALAVGGLTLPGLLKARAAEPTTPKKKAVILVWLAGGPSHIDMYDLKPDAPSEVRGEFKPIATNVPGIRIGEHLPLQAKLFDKISVVRSGCHTNAGHGMGSQWMQTGYQATIEVNDNIYPSTGSVVAKLKGPNEPGLPAYVNLPKKVAFGGAAYLGASYNPFSPDANPNEANFRVKNLTPPGRVSAERLDARKRLVGDIDTIRRDIDLKGDLGGLDTFYRDAMAMVTSPKATAAFDVGKEPAKLRDRYGRNDLGQSCLLARRLVEAGVTFVTVQAGGGWDTHSNNFTELKRRLLPQYDAGVAALIEDLNDRGLADDVLVISLGEFGRTPKINKDAGRDHWPGAMSVLYAGGGLKMGQMIGTTDSQAAYPTSKPYSPGCILSTMYHAVGVDYRHVFYDDGKRPMPVLSEGEPIKELVG